MEGDKEEIGNLWQKGVCGNAFHEKGGSFMERLNALFFFRRGGLWYNVQRFFT